MCRRRHNYRVELPFTILTLISFSLALVLGFVLMFTLVLVLLITNLCARRKKKNIKQKKRTTIKLRHFLLQLPPAVKLFIYLLTCFFWMLADCRQRSQKAPQSRL